MKLIRLFFALSVMMLAMAMAAIAQQDTTIVVPDPIGPGATLPDFLNLYSGLEAAIILILGYLHNWIPGLNLIKAKWLRIVLIGAVTAVIFAALGLNSGLGTALVFLQTVGFYELIFKRIVPPSAPAKTKTEMVNKKTA